MEEATDLRLREAEAIEVLSRDVGRGPPAGKDGLADGENVGGGGRRSEVAGGDLGVGGESGDGGAVEATAYGGIRREGERSRRGIVEGETAMAEEQATRASNGKRQHPLPLALSTLSISKRRNRMREEGRRFASGLAGTVYSIRPESDSFYNLYVK